MTFTLLAVCEEEVLVHLEDIASLCPVPKKMTQKYRIRPFKVQDSERVKEIYLDAHNSFIFPAFLAGLQKPYIAVPTLLAVHCIATTMHSLWMATIVLVVLALGVYASYRVKFIDHLNHSLTTDLNDIANFYHSGLDESSFWVAEIDANVVGFVGFRQLDGATVELQRLTVAPEYRRRGIGEHLCRQAIAYYKRKKFQKIVLECTEVHLAGKCLYAKLGFNMKDCVASPFALSAISLEHYYLILT